MSKPASSPAAAPASAESNVTSLHPASADTALPAQRHDGWTPARQAEFLRRLSATHCVTVAARGVGMSRQSAYQLRARLKGEPFDIAWTAAFRRKYDALAEAALDRAVHRVEVPHFHRGELVGTSRRYDERLTVALLAMRARLDMDPPVETDEHALYGSDDVAGLIERVETGAELWDDDPEDDE